MTPRSIVLALAVLVLPLPALALPDPSIVIDVLRGAPARHQTVASWSGPRPEARPQTRPEAPATLANPAHAAFDDWLAMIDATLDCLEKPRRGQVC
jgi:hypothetical protein